MQTDVVQTIVENLKPEKKNAVADFARAI